MKIIWCAAVIILLAGRARAADPVYARIQAASAQATLGNGKQFTTVQGDCYPFLGYDRQQTMMHLQFGPQSFWVQTEDAGLVPATNASNAAAQYNNEVGKVQAIATAPVAAPAPDPQTIQAIVNALEWPLRQMIRQEMAMHSEANSGTKGVNYADAFPVDSDSSAWQNSGVWVKAVGMGHLRGVEITPMHDGLHQNFAVLLIQFPGRTEAGRLSSTGTLCNLF